MKNYEYQLVARIIADNSAYQENSDVLLPELFVHYRDIFDAYVGIVADGRWPSLTKLTQLLPDRKQELKQMFAGVDYNVPVQDLVMELEENQRNETLNHALTQAVSRHDSTDKVRVLTDAITSIYQQERSQFEAAYDIAKRLLKKMSEKNKTGILTGFGYFDTLTEGLQPSDLIIIAAETSQGKTSFALNITENVVREGCPVAFISLEMSNEQLTDRLLASMSVTPIKELNKNYPQKESVAAELQRTPLYVADVTNNSITHIAGLIRSAHIRYGIRVAVVDYLQLVSDRSKQSREQEIGHIARTLKNLAKELAINIIAVSQLSRPHKGGSHYPTLARLRDSGQVEEAADLVLFIYRPEAYGISEYEGEDTAGMADIIIAKGRNYGTGKWRTTFNHQVTKFNSGQHPSGAKEPSGADGVDVELPF